MSDDDNNSPAAVDQAGGPVPFPQTRVRPPGGLAPFKDLGNSQLADKLGVLREQTTGHWCSPCGGIWFGTLLEVECPVCGNRNG